MSKRKKKTHQIKNKQANKQNTTTTTNKKQREKNPTSAMLLFRMCQVGGAMQYIVLTFGLSASNTTFQDIYVGVCVNILFLLGLNNSSSSSPYFHFLWIQLLADNLCLKINGKFQKQTT